MWKAWLEAEDVAGGLPLVGAGIMRADPVDQAAFLEAYGDREAIARLAALGPALTYRMGAYCAMRRRDLADGDPTALARYARAVELSIAELGGSV